MNANILSNPVKKPHTAYLMTTPTATICAMWSSGQDLPPIASVVRVTMNGFGLGRVVSYFENAGFLGIEVALDTPPAWWIAQNNNFNKTVKVFGAEITFPVA